MASAPPVEAGLDAEAVEAFVAGVRGPVLRPGDPGYDEARAIWNGLIDRQPGADRAVHGRGRRRRRGQLRPRARPARCRSRAAATTSPATPSTTTAWSIDLSQMRGVHVDPASGHRPRPGRRDLGRLRPRDAALRAGRARRRRLDDRHRRPDPARRRRPPAPQVRALDRQPALGRHRHRRRSAAHGPARPRTRTCSGRCAAPAATSASSPRSSSRRTRSARWSWSARSSTRSSRRRTRRCPAWRDYMATAPDELSSLAICWSVPPASRSRPSTHGDAGRASSPASTPGRSRRASGRAAAARARRAAARPERPVALARPAERLRRALPEGRPLLLEVARARRADRGRDRRDRRLRRASARRR